MNMVKHTVLCTGGGHDTVHFKDLGFLFVRGRCATHDVLGLRDSAFCCTAVQQKIHITNSYAAKFQLLGTASKRDLSVIYKTKTFLWNLGRTQRAKKRPSRTG